jgi:hypothetical protein
VTRTPARPLSPAAAREQRRADVARIIGHGLLDANVTHVGAAEAIGMASAHLTECAKPGGAKHLHVADAPALPLPVALDIARYIAGDAYAVIALPTGETTDVASDLLLAAAAQRESSDAISALLMGVADGHLDSREGAKLEREADEAIRALLAVREVARRAQRERVIGTTGARLASVK